MLEFSKEILQKVSFDRKLFEKELKKTLKWLGGDEKTKLKIWCLATFGTLYGDIIARTFSGI